jgi:hypothetical protein
MRDQSRPADHPLVELAHDLFAELNQAGADTLSRAPAVRRRVREVLRSARVLIAALEDLVDELDHAAPTDAKRGTTAADDDGLQTIALD